MLVFMVKTEISEFYLVKLFNDVWLFKLNCVLGGIAFNYTHKNEKSNAFIKKE